MFDQHHFMKELRETMGDYLKKIETAIAKIPAPNSQDPAAITAAVQLAVAPMQAELDTLKTSLTDENGIEQSLLDRVTDLETALSETVTHLQNGDTDSALATAQTAVPASNTGATSTGLDTDDSGLRAAGGQPAPANGDAAGNQAGNTTSNTDGNAGVDSDTNAANGT